MTLETFFEKFDLFADAPCAVGKMRELVLELAVTGKLVAQDNRDEPASSLLESTASERAKLIAARKIKSRPTSLVEPDEQPFDVPSSWSWARLLDVGYELGQKVPDKRFTYIDVGGIDSEKGQISDRVEKLEPADAPSRARKLVARGTVIYSTVRPYLLNIAIVDQDFDPEAIASTAFGILHPFEGVNNRYLFYWLRSAPFTAYVQAGMKGMAYPAINDEKFYSGYIALPPLAEQKRIVAKVDELMALCDRLEAQQQEREAQAGQLARASLARFANAPTPANLNLLFHSSFPISPSDLRKSILTLAVQGKLVPRIESEGMGSDILEKAGVSAEHPDDVPDLPAHWVWACLGCIATRMDSGWSPACIPEPSEKGEWGVLKTTAVQALQYQEEQNKALPPNLEPRPEHEVMDGDILFTRAGPMNRVGILCVARPTRKKLMISDKIIRFHLVTGIDPDFAALSMNAGHSSSVVEGLKSGMAASQVNISQPKLRSVPIPLPPLAEQRRIVAKVYELMALVDELETQLAASRAAAEKLLTALVAELTGTTSLLPADS